MGILVPRGGIDVAALVGATDTLRHRGPDDEGYLLATVKGEPVRQLSGPDTVPGIQLPEIASVERDRSAALGIGFRRLAIQDPGPWGHQPMGSPDGRLWIAFNGEIYNHRELREEPALRGRPFEGHSDTETLLAAWQAWGPACLDRLEGMWAFVLWDADAARLYLCRDRFGIKPLYFASVPGGIAFASEIPALLELGIRARAHPQALFRYARFGLTDDGPQTLFQGIRSLMPSYLHEIPLDAPTRPVERRYWALASPPTTLDPLEAERELRDRFLASVEAHLLSDVPVGVALSGGIDSSAILCGMRRALGANAEIRAFGHVADDPVLGEEAWIDLAAGEAHAALRKVQPNPAELLGDLETLVASQGEPFGSTSIYAQYRVFALARAAGTPVMLSGQGADEQLAGYRAYLGPRLATLVARRKLSSAWRFARTAASLPGFDTRGVLLRAGAMLLPPILSPAARWVAGEGADAPWLDTRWYRERGVSLVAPLPPSGRDRLRARLTEAFTTTSLPMLLRYEDRNAMHHSVESRVPFLTRPIVELLHAMPEEQLIDERANTKAIFRRAMRGIVPAAIIDRRDKVGFATPEQRWLEAIQPRIERLLADGRASGVRGIDPDAVRAQWLRIRAGRHRFDAQIWRALNLCAWARCFDVRFD